MIEIRNATASDIPIILELLYELGRPRPENNIDVDEFSNLVIKYISDDDKKILQQRVVTQDEFEKLVTEGWEYLGTLPNGKIVIKNEQGSV